MNPSGPADDGRSPSGSTAASGLSGSADSELEEAVAALLEARSGLADIRATCTRLEARLALVLDDLDVEEAPSRPVALKRASGPTTQKSRDRPSELARLRSPSAPEPPDADAAPASSRRRGGTAAVALLAAMGTLLVADAAATVAWQEPVSGLLAHQRQNRLDDQLSGIEARLPALAPSPKRRRTLEERVRLRASVARKGLRTGQPIGRIRAPRLGGSWVVVQGVGESQLKKGPSHYPTSSLPGLPGTTAIAGHRTTFGAPFRHIDRLRAGDRITVEMPYGVIDYRVEGHRIVDPSNTKVLRDIGRPRLVLTACTPLFSAAKRWVVFARQEGVRRRTMG